MLKEVNDLLINLIRFGEGRCKLNYPPLKVFAVSHCIVIFKYITPKAKPKADLAVHI